MSTKAPDFTRRKVQDLQRSLGLPTSAFACPLCTDSNDSFKSESSLFQHVKTSHAGDFAGVEFTTQPENEAWQRFIAQKAPNLSRSPPQKEREGRGAYSDTLQANTSTRRPSTAPAVSEARSNPGPDSGRPDAAIEVPGLTPNPKKRSANPASTSPEPPSEGRTTTHPQQRTRHQISASFGNVDNRDFQRPKKPASTNPQKSLFDHRTEIPPAGSSPRRPRTPHGVRGGRQGQSPGTFTPRKGNESLKESRTQAHIQGNLVSSGQTLQPRISEVPKSNQKAFGSTLPYSASQAVVTPGEPDEPQPDTSMLRQPETRPISHDQLVVEVKGIYAGLVMVEAKCIEVDEKQSLASQDEERQALLDDQWRSLIALHKQLLHEHHDFFLASQHPSASNNLSRLAGKYSMPARLWRHGIHGFLEVLRHRLPEAKVIDHMLAFIYIAYSMMALLYETVPTFEDTWIECLGDLARYRMAIEEEEPRDRDTWSGVAEYWYSKASEKSPRIGRLYHHLAILARIHHCKQLALYMKALTCVVPFESAKGSVRTSFDPILAGAPFHYPKHSSKRERARIDFERLFVKTHGTLFVDPENSIESFKVICEHLMDNLESFVKNSVRDPENWEKPNKHTLRKVLAYCAISNVAAIFEYGAHTRVTNQQKERGVPRSKVQRACEEVNFQKLEAHAFAEASDTSAASPLSTFDATKYPMMPERPAHLFVPLGEADETLSSTIIENTSNFAHSMLNYTVASQHREPRDDSDPEKDIWSHLLTYPHVMFVFTLCILQTGKPTLFPLIFQSGDWRMVCEFLNRLASLPDVSVPGVFKEDFLMPDDGRPLWEDFVLRGLLYTLFFFPPTFFSDAKIDYEERQLETSGMDLDRQRRILWLGHRIASFNILIHYNKNKQIFEPSFKILALEPKREPIHQAEETITTPVDSDTSMSDEASIAPTSRTTTLATSEPTEDHMLFSTPSTSAPTPVSTTVFDAPQDAPSTPKAPAAHEHDDDIPMMDISPGKEQPQAETSDPVAATLWEPGPPPEYSLVPPDDSVATIVAPEKPIVYNLPEEKGEDG